MKEIDLSLLREIFKYDPETGVITFKVRRGKKRPGDIAGSRKADGRIEINFSGRFVRAHRLAWALHYGEWPDAWIDHINCNVSDNRITNLRAATPGQNNRNRSMRSDNKTGFKGVSKCRGRYRADIQMPHGPKRFLGHFSSAEDAHQAYCAAADQLYGEFARHH